MTATEAAPAETDAEQTQPLAGGDPVTEADPATSGPDRQRGALPFRAALVVRALGLLALIVLGFVGYLVVLAPLEQDGDQDVLYSQVRGPIAEAVPPYAGRETGEDGSDRAVPAIYDDDEDALIPAGAPIAVLTIPSLELQQVVVEGTSSGDLRAGPGHRRDTVLPGQAGVSLIYGRATMFGGPFAQVPRLQQGEELRVVTFQGDFTYRVEGVRRAGDPLPDPRPVTDGGSRLTLVTAEGSNPWQPDRTVFVDALLDGKPQPAAKRPSLIPPEERSLAWDRPALLNLVLWMQALALLAVGMAWARVRWGRWETYLVGLPAVLGMLWYVYESAARLLPNLA